MIVKVRYRDLPWEKVIEHYTKECQAHLSRRYWEGELRGQAVRIQVPASTRRSDGCKCAGPFYLIQPNIDGSTAVCPHIAEIGD